MTSHPNRSTWRSDLPVPTGADWRALLSGRTQQAFADAHGLRLRQVQAYLAEEDRPHWALYELVLLREGQHPTHRLVER